jgi:hypothetical protein
MINASESILPAPNARRQNYATKLTSAELRSKLEDALAFDKQLADSFLPSEEGNKIRIVSPSRAHGDIVLTFVCHPEINHVCLDYEDRDYAQACHILDLIGDQVAHRSKPWLTRKHKPLPPRHRNELADLLREFREDPFSDSITMTGAAISSGMRCMRWKDKDLLMEELFFLSDIGRQLADRDDDYILNRERIKVAMRPHTNHRSVMVDGEIIPLPYQHDICDEAAGIALRVHFAEDDESCRIIVGLLEEVEKNS